MRFTSSSPTTISRYGPPTGAESVDWSDDGRFLLASRRMAAGLPLWHITDPGDPARRKSQPYVEAQHSAVRGKFAPPLPAANGGTQPRWRRDGRLPTETHGGRCPGLQQLSSQVSRTNSSIRTPPVARERRHLSWSQCTGSPG